MLQLPFKWASAFRPENWGCNLHSSGLSKETLNLPAHHSQIFERPDHLAKVNKSCLPHSSFKQMYHCYQQAQKPVDVWTTLMPFQRTEDCNTIAWAIKIFAWVIWLVKTFYAHKANENTFIENNIVTIFSNQSIKQHSRTRLYQLGVFMWDTLHTKHRD